MSLSRLHDLLIPYIFNYLDPDKSIRKCPEEIDITCSEESLGLTRVFTKNKALTVFAANTDIGNLFFEAGFQAESCFQEDIRIIHRKDADHHLFHKNPNEYNSKHTHVLKGKIQPEEISVHEIKCIIDRIKDTEKENKLCQDGKNHCMLPNQDAEKIHNSYQKYIQQKNNSLNLDAQVENIYATLEAQFIAGAQFFTHAFITTFIDKYLIPYLNDRETNQIYITIVELLKNALTSGLSPSLLDYGVASIIRHTLTSALTKLDIDPAKVDMISYEVGVVMAFTKNPLSLINLSINTTAALAGQSAAYRVIRALPKLKLDPSVPENNEDAADVIIKENNVSPTNNITLRKRYY